MIMPRISNGIRRVMHHLSQYTTVIWVRIKSPVWPATKPVRFWPAGELSSQAASNWIAPGAIDFEPDDERVPSPAMVMSLALLVCHVSTDPCPC